MWITLSTVLDVLEGLKLLIPERPVCENSIFNFPLLGDWGFRCPALMLSPGVATRWQCFRGLFYSEGGGECGWQTEEGGTDGRRLAHLMPCLCASSKRFKTKTWKVYWGKDNVSCPLPRAQPVYIPVISWNSMKLFLPWSIFLSAPNTSRHFFWLLMLSCINARASPSVSLC